jgi:exosortase
MNTSNHHAGIKYASGLCHTENVSQNNGNVLLLAVTLPLAIMVWSYGPTIELLWEDWQTNDDYSAGQLVPVVALFLLWSQRNRLAECPWSPCWAGGVALLLSAQAASIYQFLAGGHPSIERYLMILALTGLILAVAGWQVLRRIIWILLFLLLMVPLPGRIHNLIGGPLQGMATGGAVFILEAFGATVSRQGNVIVLNDTIPMAVAEACSGLRMLTAFVIVAATLALISKRSRLKKTIVLLSSIPVAVICNILRLCMTAVLFMWVSAEVGQKFFHDFAGLAMMPVAALFLFAELWLLDKLIVPEPDPTREKTNSYSRSTADAGVIRRNKKKGPSKSRHQSR